MYPLPLVQTAFFLFIFYPQIKYHVQQNKSVFKILWFILLFSLLDPLVHGKIIVIYLNTILSWLLNILLPQKHHLAVK